MKRKRSRKGPLVIFLVFVLLAGCIVIIRTRLTPVVNEMAITRVKNKTSDLINDAIAEQVTLGNIDYDSIIYFEKDINGRITALKTNMSEVNRLKTDVLNIINDQILENDSNELGIHVGNLILPDLFAGRGPVIPVRIIAISNSDAEFTSRFSQAGINQTLQQLTLQVIVDVTVLLPMGTQSVQVATQMVVAETIIVGTVPNTYVAVEDAPINIPTESTTP